VLGGFICPERYLILQTPSNYILANDFINVHSVINLQVNNYWSEIRMIKAQPLVSRPETTDWLTADD
jgi:hypothetical protein